MSGIPLNITFGSQGDCRLWEGAGWHSDQSDATHTWSSSIATLRIFLDEIKRDVTLTMYLTPISAPDLIQELFVYLNGRFVGFWQVSQGVQLTASVDAKFFERGENVLTFVLPKAICPNIRGLSGDKRVLGAAFSKLSLAY